MVKTIFVSKYNNIQEITKPEYSKNNIPKWFKNLPIVKSNASDKLIKPNSKSCPSFISIYKEGYIIKAPCDILLKVDGDKWEWNTPSTMFNIEIHEDEQLLDYLPRNHNIKKVFKLIYPFSIITPKGYSVRQVPIYYDFNSDWEVAYGVYDTDRLHDINPQILYKSDKKEILIKQHTPLMQLVPFKRENNTMIVVNNNKRYSKILDTAKYKIISKFNGGYYINE